MSEVAIIGLNDETQPADVLLKKKNNGELISIRDTHRCFDPLHFVLLMPNGDDGWYPHMKSLSLTDDGKERSVTPLEYFRYRMQIRPNEFNILKRSARLYQEYVVVAQHKIKNCRLKWVEDNQKKIKADKYKGLLDAAAANDDLENVGSKRTTILPPTFAGSKRWYQEQFQDSMAIVRTYGKPHLFVTFTANAQWDEIKKSLFEGQDESLRKERPDLVAAVFHERQKELMDDILKRQVFGTVIAIVSVIEWQKRGLPHIHMLLTLDSEDDPRTPADVDKLISAQIPDKTKNPKLFEIVKKQMVHGPCGYINPDAPCMVKNKCSKNFPKALIKDTSVNPDNGEVLLARPAPEDGGNTMEIYVSALKKYVTIDNRWIVPYNPAMLLKYQGHMNVEKVNSVKAVKYCYMYLAKGPDRIVIQNNEPDEIKTYRDTSYTSASQAEWEIQGNVISYKEPNVTKLPCHLENEQFVMFDEGDDIQQVMENYEKTKLTEFFRLNREDPEANSLTYLDIPRYYTYNKQSNSWKRRKRNTVRANIASKKRVKGFLCPFEDIDRRPAFYGKQLDNSSNLCYLNSSINGLFSLKTVRSFLLADEPANDLKVKMRSILTGAVKTAEYVRQHLEQEFGNIYDFTQGKQVYIGDAIVSLLASLGLEESSRYTLKIERKCLTCCYKMIETKSGALHFFTLYEDTESTNDMIHSDQFIDLEKCPGCGRGTFCKEYVSISEPNRYLLLGCARPLGCEKEVYPSEMLEMEDGTSYQIKSVINYHPGCTLPGEESGHYTCSLKLENQWHLVNDMNPIEQLESAPSNGMIFIYELAEEQTNEVPENEPVHFDDEVWNNINNQSHAPEAEEKAEEEGLKMLSREIGRIPVIPFNNFSKELFHLRNLLHVVKGPKSFNDIRTVDGYECATYQEAAIKLGLFEDDKAIEQTLEEAFSIKIGRAFRHCFVVLMIHATPADPLSLYEKFAFKLCEDFMPRDSVLAEPTEAMKNKALNEMNALFKEQGHDMVERFHLPAPTDANYSLTGDRLELQRELDYDREALRTLSDDLLDTLNFEQRVFVNAIIESVEGKKGLLAFLQAVGGTGKTHVLKTLLAYLRSSGKVVIAMGTTGIAATLLDGGGTIHTKTRAPVDLHEKSMCNYSDKSGTAELIRQADLVVIDEATIGDRLLYECLDRSFRNTRKNDQPFGGITMVFSGDWHQCLPVVPGGGPADIIRQTLKRSYLWPKVILLLSDCLNATLIVCTFRLYHST